MSSPPLARYYSSHQLLSFQTSACAYCLMLSGDSGAQKQKELLQYSCLHIPSTSNTLWCVREVASMAETQAGQAFYTTVWSLSNAALSSFPVYMH